MARIEIKRNIVLSEMCACGHSGKRKIIVKGVYSSPLKELLLCDACFKELKEKLNEEI